MVYRGEPSLMGIPAQHHGDQRRRGSSSQRHNMAQREPQMWQLHISFVLIVVVPITPDDLPKTPEDR